QNVNRNFYEFHSAVASSKKKLDLVAAPTERLTEDEWIQVTTRSILQEESAKLCAIHTEEFCLQAQGFLSCSHVFHRNCMQAFEWYSGRKCCPVCRREHYETSYWRGYIACKKYKNIQKIKFPKDKKMTRQFLHLCIIKPQVFPGRRGEKHLHIRPASVFLSAYSNAQLSIFAQLQRSDPESTH
uniref:RING-type domain-containing protein n=1 Tax=Xiphophorus maculatus TaxID=8083 RepID=A0A3B5R0W3_XIPMA